MNQQHKIPEGWRNVELDSLAIDKGLVRGPFGGAIKKEMFTTSGYKVYEQRNAIYGSDKLGEYYIDENKFSELKRFSVKPGDFIVSCSGTIGRIYQIPQNAPQGVINQALLKITIDKSKINDRYFYYQFSWDKFQSKVVVSTQGGAMQNLVGMDIFRKTNFILPPLSEQKRIVQILETWEQYVGILNQKLRIKKRLRHSLLQKLVADNYYKNAIKVKIKDICDISRGGSPRPIEQFITKDPNGYNWLRIGDIENDAMFIQSTSEKIIPEGLKKTTLVNPGDFILSNSMSFGRPYIMKISACIHDGWLALRNINKKVDKFFLFYLLTSDKMQNTFKSLAAGSGVRNLKKEIVSEISINLPDLEEQEHIAKILLSLDEEINLLKKQKSLVVKQKNYLLNNLITGQIRVPEFASHN